MKMTKFMISALLATLSVRSANAAVTLLENDWKIQMYGFIEQDVTKDSTRSLPETVGNNGLANPGKLAGDNGRLFFSNRNSRLGFIIGAPEGDGWKTQGRFEFDFLGYEPAANSAGGPSESSYWSFGALRIRLANFTAEKEGLTLQAGQSWSLFGWQPTFVPPTVSVPPEPGVLYQRTGAISAIEAYSPSEDSKLSVGLSVERPSQADAQMPNLVVGVKYANGALKSGLSSSYGDEKVEPMTVALSATSRTFETPSNPANTTGHTNKTGTGVALDTLIPILPASEGKPGSSLMFIGEASSGQGYADELPAWTGGLTAMTGGAAPPYLPNLDAGQAGYDAGANFTLVKETTWNASLQYHLRDDAHTWFTGGFSHVSSSNIASLTTNGKGPSYFSDDFEFINVNHDCTKAIRVAFEYGKLTTTFIDNSIQHDDRYQATFLYRF